MQALVYTSIARIEFDRESISDLCDQAAVANFEMGVTGYLYFRKGHFLQYLEGETSTLKSLMDRIQNDERHSVSKVIYDDNVSARRFPTWSMLNLPLDEIQFEDTLMNRLGILRLPNVDLNFNSQIWNAVDKLSEFRSCIYI